MIYTENLTYLDYNNNKFLHILAINLDEFIETSDILTLI